MSEKNLGKTLEPESLALPTPERKVNPDKILEQVKGFAGTVLKTSLAKDVESRLRESVTKA